MHYLFYGIFCLSLCTMIACQKDEKPTTTLATQNNNAPTIQSGISSFIDSAAANVQIASYLSSIDTFNTAQVKSFILDAASLRTYLANNAIEQIKIMIGHQSVVIGSSLPTPYQYLNTGSMSLVLVGVDNNNNYVYHNTNEVINRSRDCPINCYVTGNASNDLLTP